MMNSTSENIKNAFLVVHNTLENVKKLMQHCDRASGRNGYTVSTEDFLTNSIENSTEGWTYNKFIKLYQCVDDDRLRNDWRSGPVYVLEINLEEEPTYYISKFEYEDISKWRSGVAPNDFSKFYYPTDLHHKIIDLYTTNGEYVIASIKEEFKNQYLGLQKVTFKTGDLLDLSVKNIDECVFEEFDKLAEISFEDYMELDEMYA